jgi:YidC/Oxa1 family membrane protein insertase
MEKRLILAMAISMFILFLWSALFPQPRQPAVSVISRQPQAPVANLITPSPSSEEIPSSEYKFVLPKREIVFLEPQASIKEVIFKDYQGYKYSLKNAFFLQDKGLRFQRTQATTNKITYIYQDKEKMIIKDFLFHNSNYSLDLEIEIQNLSPATLNFQIPLLVGTLDFKGDQNRVRFQDVSVSQEDKSLRFNGHKDVSFEHLISLAIRDKYFCLLVEPLSKYTGFIKRISNQESSVGLIPPEIKLEPGKKIQEKFRIYLGPQDLHLISQIKPDWTFVVHYGSFDFISNLFLQLLEIFYRLVHNWGMAIIILSLTIYFLLFPITLRQMRSLKEMQVLQPKIEELRKIYKDNAQKLNKEIMQLYQEHKVNPFGGCLPLILQIPIFFALYQTLLRSIALKGANFLWIKDLSEPDRLFLLPFSLPLLGNEINLLPIIMCLGMFLQQRLSLAGTRQTAPEQQRLMTIFMPLLFGLIFYRLPAGLVLYWLANSLLMLIYQLRINRIK